MEIPPDIEPDCEDLLGTEPPASSDNLIVMEYGNRKHSAWINITGGDVSEGGNTDNKHKASILRLYSDPMSLKGSCDRLKRVRGYSRYEMPSNTMNTDPTLGTDLVVIDDPIIVLIECKQRAFMCIVKIVDILVGVTHVDSVEYKTPLDNNIRIKGQIMQLVPHISDGAKSTDAQSDMDWEWNGRYESRKLTSPEVYEFAADSVEPINPLIGTPSCKSTKVPTTWLFSTSELLLIAQLLSSRTAGQSLTQAQFSDTFPYREQTGAVCFLCEKEGEALQGRDTINRCVLCPGKDIGSNSQLLTHMGAHILYHKTASSLVNACGLCLSTGNICTIFLKKGKGADRPMTIDMKRSHCPNLYAMKIGTASKSTKYSPCTNIPLQCPLCPADSPAVWKYNLEKHIMARHPTSHLETLQHHYAISSLERDELKRRHYDEDGVQPRLGKRKRRDETQIFRISESHSLKMVLR